MDGIRWLTYDDMAVALGITHDSAKRLAQRRKWPRKPSNDGRVMVAVPEDRIAQAADGGGAVEDDVPDDADVNVDVIIPPVVEDDGGGARALMGYLERRVEELSEELTEARTEARGARFEADSLRVRAGQVEVLAALVEAERSRVADVRSEMTALVEVERQRTIEARAEGKALLDAVAAERDRLLAVVAEQRRPWLARLLNNIRQG